MSTEESGPSSQGHERKKVRFHMDIDIFLLKEVVDVNPYADPSGWKRVAQLLSCEYHQEFNNRNVRERVEYLLKVFSQKERVLLRKSGTEEQYTTRDLLLEDIKALRDEFKASRRTTHPSDTAKGLRDEAAIRAMNMQMNEDSTNVESWELNPILHEVNVTNTEVQELAEAAATDPNFHNLERNSTQQEEPLIIGSQGQHFLPTAEGPIEQPTSSAVNRVEIHPQPLHERPEIRPQKRAHLKRSAADFMKEKQKHEADHRKILLELKKRKLDIDERRVAVEERKTALAEKQQDCLERIMLKNIDLLDILINKLQ